MMITALSMTAQMPSLTENPIVASVFNSELCFVDPPRTSYIVELCCLMHEVGNHP